MVLPLEKEQSNRELRKLCCGTQVSASTQYRMFCSDVYYMQECTTYHETKHTLHLHYQHQIIRIVNVKC